MSTLAGRITETRKGQAKAERAKEPMCEERMARHEKATEK